MTLTQHNPDALFPPSANDAHAVEVLKRRLGTHHAARTVVCAGMLEPGWLVEIEAVAAAS